jgi:hypothetical protein
VVSCVAPVAALKLLEDTYGRTGLKVLALALADPWPTIASSLAWRAAASASLMPPTGVAAGAAGGAAGAAA